LTSKIFFDNLLEILEIGNKKEHYYSSKPKHTNDSDALFFIK